MINMSNITKTKTTEAILQFLREIAKEQIDNYLDDIEVRDIHATFLLKSAVKESGFFINGRSDVCILTMGINRHQVNPG